MRNMGDIINISFVAKKEAADSYFPGMVKLTMYVNQELTFAAPVNDHPGCITNQVNKWVNQCLKTWSDELTYGRPATLIAQGSAAKTMPKCYDAYADGTPCPGQDWK